MMAGEGDRLPVSALPVDGTYPTGTAKWEKRNLAQEIPVWEQDICIQCGKCVMVCPHAVIRAKVCEPRAACGQRRQAFKSAAARWKDREHLRYMLQVAPEDCTGCGLCVEVCPAKSKSEAKKKAVNMAPQAPIREQETPQLGILPEPSGIRPRSARRCTTSRTFNCCSRCSNFRAPARAAARPRTSSC